MIDLQKDKCIKHLPKKRISTKDSVCLGYDSNYDFWLVFEEGEFRIYSYEWWSYDSITDGEHEDEDWREDCCHYFEAVDGCLDLDSCEYLPVKFENTNPEGMAYEIWEATEDLEDNYSITDREGDGPNDKLINFYQRTFIK